MIMKRRHNTVELYYRSHFIRLSIFTAAFLTAAALFRYSGKGGGGLAIAIWLFMFGTPFVGLTAYNLVQFLRYRFAELTDVQEARLGKPMDASAVYACFTVEAEIGHLGKCRMVTKRVFSVGPYARMNPNPAERYAGKTVRIGYCRKTAEIIVFAV